MYFHIIAFPKDETPTLETIEKRLIWAPNLFICAKFCEKIVGVGHLYLLCVFICIMSRELSVYMQHKVRRFVLRWTEFNSTRQRWRCENNHLRLLRMPRHSLLTFFYIFCMFSFFIWRKRLYSFSLHSETTSAESLYTSLWNDTCSQDSRMPYLNNVSGNRFAHAQTLHRTRSKDGSRRQQDSVDLQGSSYSTLHQGRINSCRAVRRRTR